MNGDTICRDDLVSTAPCASIDRVKQGRRQLTNPCLFFITLVLLNWSYVQVEYDATDLPVT